MKMVELHHKDNGAPIRVPACDVDQMKTKGWLPLEHKVNKAAAINIEESETE